MLYLDNNATTRPLPEVVDAVCAALRDHWHNPSAFHRAGQVARQKVELSRRTIAKLLGAKPAEIIFTSGGTESIELAIRGSLPQTTPDATPPVLITTPVEHHAVAKLARSLEACGAIELRTLPVDGDGVMRTDALADALRECAGRIALVSVQWVNNETGAVQPVREVGEMCRDAGVRFHCDGTQWVGKAPTNLAETPIDLLTCAAHKMHGPKGVGALFVRQGVRVQPSLHGSQELGRRGGTENVPGICGFAAAAESAMRWLDDACERARLCQMRDAFERALLNAIPGAERNGPADSGESPGQRLWTTANISFPGVESEILLVMLSEKGVCASAGSACASGSTQASGVLTSMGLCESRVGSAVRFSIARETTQKELDEAVPLIVETVRSLTPARQTARA